MEALVVAVVVASLVPDARGVFAKVCHNLAELAWHCLANLPTFAWPELPLLGGTRARFRIICGTALLGYVFRDANSPRLRRLQRFIVWLSKRLELPLVLLAAFLFDAVALLLRVVVVATAQIILATRNRRTACLIVLLSIVQEAVAMEDEKSGRSRPPMFSGLRPDWTKWIISFTIWLAYHANECSDLLDGLDHKPLPTPPAPPSEPLVRGHDDGGGGGAYGAYRRPIPGLARRVDEAQPQALWRARHSHARVVGYLALHL